jgi:hypothetical protein
MLVEQLQVDGIGYYLITGVIWMQNFFMKGLRPGEYCFGLSEMIE